MSEGGNVGMTKGKPPFAFLRKASVHSASSFSSVSGMTGFNR